MSQNINREETNGAIIRYAIIGVSILVFTYALLV